MPMSVAEIVPRARIDLTTTALDGADRRMTVHSGTAVLDWEKRERIVRGGLAYPISFFMPDAMAYTSPPEMVTGTASIAQFSLSPGQIVESGPYGLRGVGFQSAPDPRGNGLHWATVSFEVFSPPDRMEIADQVTVIAAPDSISS